jgi:hypothetical protein
MDYSHVLPNFKIPLEASLLSDTYKQSLLNDDTFFNTLGDWFTAMESHPLNNTDKNGSHPSMGVVKWWVDEMYKYINEKSNNNIL